MALLTANGVTILSASIDMPLQGVWTADLRLDNPDGSGFDGGTKVTISSPQLQLIGVVDPDRTGDFLDSSHVRIIGGAGGMAKPVSARGYTQPGAFVRDVLSGITGDVGESLSATTDPSFLTTNLTAWATFVSPASQALQTLIDFTAAGSSWRILTDGTLWIGQEQWPNASGTFDILSQDPAQQTFELGVESPFILPGTTLAGVGQINRVVHAVDSSTVRSRVQLTVPGGRGPAAAIKALVTAATAAFDYCALYQAKVISQSGNTVDVQPTAANLPGLSRVALRHGLPGVSLTVAPGCSILVGWDGGNPASPYACLWGGGEQVIELDIAANGNISLSANGAATLKGATATKLGNVGTLPVLVQGTVDSLGVPVTQNPAASATTVLAG